MYLSIDEFKKKTLEDNRQLLHMFYEQAYRVLITNDQHSDITNNPEFMKWGYLAGAASVAHELFLAQIESGHVDLLQVIQAVNNGKEETPDAILNDKTVHEFFYNQKNMENFSKGNIFIPALKYGRYLVAQKREEKKENDGFVDQEVIDLINQQTAQINILAHLYSDNKITRELQNKIVGRTNHDLQKSIRNQIVIDENDQVIEGHDNIETVRQENNKMKIEVLQKEYFFKSFHKVMTVPLMDYIGRNTESGSITSIMTNFAPVYKFKTIKPPKPGHFFPVTDN